MEKSRKQQVEEALAINNLGGVELDKETLDLFDQYINYEIDYENLLKLVN